MARKLTLKVSAIYNPEQRDGFKVTEAHYLAQATVLVAGKELVVNGAGSTPDRAINELEKAAATACGIETYEIGTEWNEGGRVNFPAEVESRIAAAETKKREFEAEKARRNSTLAEVAREIMRGGGLPEGYAWRLVTPYDPNIPTTDSNRGERVWLYAEKAGDDDTHCLAIAFKHVGGSGFWHNRGGKEEIWIEGPGWGSERGRCKARSKGDWIAKAANLMCDHLAAKAEDIKRCEQVRAAAQAHRQRVADFRALAGVKDNDGSFGTYGDGSWSINGVNEAGRVSLSMTAGNFLPEDAAAILKLIREASDRRIAADKASVETKVQG